MGVDLRMVKRKEHLIRHMSSGILKIEDGMVLHEAGADSHLHEGQYTVCGLWYKGKKVCGKKSACVFNYISPPRGMKCGAVASRKHESCNYSDQKVRANVLTEERVIEKIGTDWMITTVW
jgi:hypothetical protein